MSDIMGFIASTFGYLLNFIYEIVKNYGIAIILFSIVLKIILLPIAIKQQKMMKKSKIIQEKSKAIQEKYKGNQEKINTETLALYKMENMSPFGGCLSSIVQIILLLSIFYLVRSPLTFMRKVDETTINNYKNEMQQEKGEKEKATAYPEIAIIKENGSTDEKVYINMNFLGLDLSNIPSQDYKEWTVYIIPILYVISSFVSMKFSANIGNKNEDKKKNEEDPMAQANKSMTWLMPIMSVSISLIAPLGLALYWLINNLLMIIERILINKFFDKEEKTKMIEEKNSIEEEPIKGENKKIKKEGEKDE